ncbi:MAG: M48 family metallopeptidase [Vicinamibacterales bacterium]
MSGRRQLALPLTGTAGVGPDDHAVAAAPPVIRFVRRRGTRRYILRVADDGSLRVTVPWWGSQREARTFVAAQAAWIARQRLLRQTALADRRWPAGRDVLVDGVPRRLAVADAGGVLTVRCGDDALGPAPPDGDLRPVAERWLRRRAVRELPPALLALAAQHGVTVTRTSVRNQQSRWGSCSRRGAIALNWRLVQVPPDVREYVLVHELMHRRELNHSPRFWRHVAAACPRYLEARRWLRTVGQSLF